MVRSERKANSTKPGSQCSKYAQTVNITQTIYLCRISFLPEDHPLASPFRFTKESYENITTYPYYQQRMECRDPYEETQEACYCAAGWNNWKCDNELPRKCKTDILKPDMAGGCPGAVDSDEYVYSIKGYDPCHEMDFNQPYEIEYNVTCRDVDDRGRVIAKGHQEGLGYEYLDLVSVDTTNLKPFDYKFVNNKTGLRMIDNPDMDFVFDFRDFKYLSHTKRHQQKITDPEIMGGVKTG